MNVYIRGTAGQHLAQLRALNVLTDEQFKTALKQIPGI